MGGVLAFQLYDWHYFFAELLNGLTLGSLYALIALGYTMVYGVLKLLNFAHGDVFMIGMYVGWFVLTGLGGVLSPNLPLVPFFVLMFAAAMVACGALNVVIERFAYRPLRTAPRIAPLITAIGVSFFIEQTTVLLWGANPRQYDFFEFRNGTLFNPPAFTIGNLSVQYAQIFVIVTALVLMIALSLFVWRTRTGKAMRAVSFDREAASMMGIDIDRVIMVTFLLGGALAGAAGVMWGIVQSSFNPYTGFGVGLKAFTAAVVGGIGNVGGAMLGGLLIGLAETFTAGYLTSTFQDLVVFSVLVAFMLVRPTGLRGMPILQKV
jgi:branched-chain amino acid transport system permease protein